MAMSRDPAPERRHGAFERSATPVAAFPLGHVGEFVIPGTGRRVWWTGRVAIGLLYQPERFRAPLALDRSRGNGVDEY
jgi:hypothetical protein